MKNKDLRIFGLIWAFIILIIAVFPKIKNQESQINEILVYFSLFFAVFAIIYPKIFKITYFYQGWIKIGDFIGKINSKIIILALFYLLFLPIGIILKIFRKDLLNKKINSSSQSYFLEPEKQEEDMKNQF